MNTEESKVCRKCGLHRPITDYYHAGRDTACKKCYCNQSVAWAKANPEKIRTIKQRCWKRPKRFAEARRHRERYPEKVRAAKRKSYEKNRANYNKKAKEWAKANGYRVQKAWQKRHVKNAGPYYIRKLLSANSPIRPSQWPESFVLTKAQLIILKRYAKQQQGT